MRIEVKVPQLPESVAEATLVSWHKKAGEAVARDENLIDIETDKVVLELPAPGDGVLVEIVQGRRLDGRRRSEVIAVIDTEAQGAAASRRRAAAPSRSRQRLRPRQRPQRRARRHATSAAASATALPAARKMMAEQGIDPRGRSTAPAAAAAITKGDVARSDGRSAAPAPPPAAPAAAPAPAAHAAHRACRLPAALRRAARAARADVAAAPARRRAARAVAIDRGDPHDVQRSQHAAGHRAAQPVQGALREGARREARLHELLRQGGGARAEEVSRSSTRRSTATTSSTTATSTSASPSAARAASSCRSCATPTRCRSPTSRSRSPNSASARRTASSPSRS